MRCTECGADIDELNESQPVCPGCGAPPGLGRDDLDVTAILDEAELLAADPSEPEDQEVDPGPDLDRPLDEQLRLPADLELALDDAESLLLALGQNCFASFHLPGQGVRVFPYPTTRVM